MREAFVHDCTRLHPIDLATMRTDISVNYPALRGLRLLVQKEN